MSLRVNGRPKYNFWKVGIKGCKLLIALRELLKVSFERSTQIVDSSPWIVDGFFSKNYRIARSFVVLCNGKAKARGKGGRREDDVHLYGLLHLSLPNLHVPCPL